MDDEAQELARAMVVRLRKFNGTPWSTDTLNNMRSDVHAFLVERYPNESAERLGRIVLAFVRLDEGAGRLAIEFEDIAAAVRDPSCPLPESSLS